jgi:hypothetical protein
MEIGNVSFPPLYSLKNMENSTIRVLLIFLSLVSYPITIRAIQHSSLVENSSSFFYNLKFSSSIQD